MKKAILCAGFLAAATGLAGCDTIGDGVAPVEVMLVPGESGQMRFNEDGVLTLTECLPGSVDAILRFSNGSAGLVTNRSENIRYSSSNNTVIMVSNLDVPVPGGQVFQRASLVPISPGEATITVEYVGLRGSIDVIVEELANVTLEPEQAFTMVPWSQRPLVLRATVLGQTTSVSGAAHWTLTDVLPDEVQPLTINSANGVVSAWQPGSATAHGELFVCSGFIDPNDLDITLPGRVFEVDVNVEHPSSLDIVREFDDGHPLIVGLSEYLRAEAQFNSGADAQDLTTLAAWSADEPEVGNVLSAAAEGSRSIVITPRGTEDEPNLGGNTLVTARFAYCDLEQYDACYDPDEDDVPEDPIDGVGPLNVFTSSADLQVERGEVLGLAFARNGETITTLEIPEGCAIQPDLVAELRTESEQEFERRINRDAFFEVITEDEEDDGDNGDNGAGGDDGDGDGGNGDDNGGDDEPVDPTKVVSVATNTTLPLAHNAGMIGAIGKAGQTASIRASIRAEPSLPNPQVGEDEEAPELEMRTAELEVSIIEAADCALLNDN